MASCKLIITLALAKLGVTGGAKAPRPANLDLGLNVLRSLYRSLITSGVLGRPVSHTLTDGECYTARENDRILHPAGVIATYTLPITIAKCTDDDSRFYDRFTATARPPRDGAYVIINDQLQGRTEDWLYEAYTARWISIFDLSLFDGEPITNSTGGVIGYREESIAPLSRDENGLAAALAVRLADYFGATLNPLTIEAAVRWQAALTLGFGESLETQRGEYY